MRRLADGLYQLRGFPPNAINVYVLGDVLIDAATRQGERRIMRELGGAPRLSAHALTHAHPDHQGSSHAICERLGIPLWCGEGDVAAMQTPGGVASGSGGWQTFVQRRFWTGPPHPVARVLREGDEVAGFRVLETPGHSPGHVAYWREGDRVLVLGDVLTNVNVLTGRPGPEAALHERLPTAARRGGDAARRLHRGRVALAAPQRDPQPLADRVA